LLSSSNHHWNQFKITVDLEGERLMKRQTIVVIGAGLAVLLVGGLALFTSHLTPHTSHQASVKATYYCPMHPSYTSDRPGDCPICNMKLVKSEEAAPSTPPAPARGHEGTSTQFASICYLHNCPKLHEGKPCPMTVVATPGEKVTCPICGTHVAEAAAAPGARKILYWTDPMIPDYKADGPGKSPMGMDLVPVYEEEEGGSTAGAASPAGYAPVLITPQKQQLIGVTTAPVQRRSMTKTIRTVGRIAYDPELYQTEAEYLQSLKALQQAQPDTNAEATEQARRLMESSRMKLRLLGLSQQLIDEMADWDGPDKSLLLADPSGRVWLYAPIYEFELPFVSVGQTVTIESQAIPGMTLSGTIRSIDSVLDPSTRSARVRAVVTGPEGMLKPEMYVNASIVVNIGDVLAIPEEAVFDTGTKRIVFVDKGQGLFEPRDVTIGLKADGYSEVKAGVAEGESVVTSGNFLIDSESRLRGARQGVSGQEHQHGQ
jgi:hypothetical protein